MKQLLNQRFLVPQSSAMAEVTEMAARYGDVINLSIGDPDIPTPRGIIQQVYEDALAGHTKYTDPRGYPELRQAIRDFYREEYGDQVEDQEVFVTASGVVGMYLAMQVLLNPGDEVLVPTPNYSLWSNSVYLAGGRPVFYVCDEKAHWCPDAGDIRAKITDRTKAIVLINPNNPTGVLYPAEILSQVAEIARENDLLVFSDEIYDRLVMDGLEHTSFASLAPDLPVVTMNGLSKSHCLCGYRCGWMVISGPEHLTEEYRQGIVQLTSMRLCSNTLAQLVIPAALEDMETPSSMVRPGGRIYEQRQATVDELEKIDGLTFVKNDAAFYLFPKLDIQKFHITDDRKFARDLLHATNILLVPGSGFDWPEPDHFRIVMLPEAKELHSAMGKMGAFLDGYRQD